MKRRLLLFVLVLLVLTVPARAAGVESWNVTATVAPDGETMLSVSLVIRLDSPTNRLVFPLGEGAGNLTVNGVSCRVVKFGGIPSAVLESDAGFSGTLRFDMTYTLNCCLDRQETWNLVLPLVCEGMGYTVNQVDFQITFPGAVTGVPTFESGYMGADVDNYITCNVQDNVLTGRLSAALRDHEFLTLSIETDPEQFPRVGVAGSSQVWSLTVAVVLLILALVYWGIFLWWKPLLAPAQPQTPPGVNPGLVNCHLLGRRPDFSLMILSWAQAGYLSVFLERDQTVTLYKRMDMGNERSAYECHIFKTLFGRRQEVETCSRSFEALRDRVQTNGPKLGKLYRRSGNPMVLRLLGMLSGAFFWVAMADGLVPAGGGRWFPMVLLALAGLAASGMIQTGLVSLLSRDSQPGLYALGASLLTLIMGIASGRMGLAVLVVLIQTVLGLAVLFGGRRSQQGRESVQSLLGLRKYLRRMDAKRVNRMMTTDPGYYYSMSTWALALGVDRVLARRFSRVSLPESPWLYTELPVEGGSTGWYKLLRRTASLLQGKFPRQKETDPHDRRSRTRTSAGRTSGSRSGRRAGNASRRPSRRSSTASRR